MLEIWKDIEGKEELYQVSNLGRVRSLDTIIVNSLGVSKSKKGKILKDKLYKGTVIVQLNTGSKSVASLCAKAFVPNNTLYNFVKHKDGNPLNNTSDNLFWTTNQKPFPSSKKLLTTFQKCDDINKIEEFIADKTNCVVYKLINIYNGKFYIGSAKNFYNRAMSHIAHLSRNKHQNDYLQNSWNKYGSANFKFEIVEECNEDNKLEREQYYLDTLKPIYNFHPMARGGHSEKSCTPEIRKKLSEANLNRWANMSESERATIKRNMSIGIRKKRKTI